MNKTEIIVTIRCITYNHENFIRQCLEGFLMQKTNFKYEILIHDDASTDQTTNIIREYASIYPEIIVPLYEKENQYSKFGHLMTVRVAMDAKTRGKYTALCEGDDYWTDPNKLQKQVDFLETHSDYSMCFHQTIRHYQSGGTPDTLYYDKLESRDYSGLEMYKSCRPAEASVVMRSSVLKSDVYKKFVQMKLSFGDIPVFLTCAHCGKVYAMTKPMAVYRIHKDGISNIFKKPNKMVLKFAEDNLKLYKIFGKEYKRESTQIYVIDTINYFLLCIKNGEFNWAIIIKILLRHPIITIKFLKERYKNSRYNIFNNN